MLRQRYRRSFDLPWLSPVGVYTGGFQFLGSLSWKFSNSFSVVVWISFSIALDLSIISFFLLLRVASKAIASELPYKESAGEKDNSASVGGIGEQELDEIISSFRKKQAGN